VSTSAICTNLTVYFQFSLLVSFCSFLYKPKCCFCSCFAFLLLFFMFCIPLCFTYCLSGPCSRSNFCLLLCLITSNIDSYQHSIAPCMHTDRRLGKGKEQTKHASNDSFCFAFTWNQYTNPNPHTHLQINTSKEYFYDACRLCTSALYWKTRGYFHLTSQLANSSHSYNKASLNFIPTSITLLNRRFPSDKPHTHQ